VDYVWVDLYWQTNVLITLNKVVIIIIIFFYIIISISISISISINISRFHKNGKIFCVTIKANNSSFTIMTELKLVLLC